MVRLNCSFLSLLARICIVLRVFSTAFFSSSGNYTLKSASNQIKRGATTLYDSMTDIQESRSNMFFFDEVESTMTKARELLAENVEKTSFAVVAGHQNAGKGTRGRKWVSGSGNLFLTVVLKLKSIPTPLNLIPLRVGTLVIPSIQSRVTSGVLTTLKWPNDVLIGEEKVCGVLIEVEGDYMLIGIGCNIMTAPAVENVGADNGRQATCLSRHITGCEASTVTESGDSAPTADTCPYLGNLHKEIAAEIYGALSSYTLWPHDTAEQVVVDFERYMSFSTQRLRGDTAAGQEIIPLGVNKDGTLQVRNTGDDSERTLIADYLW